MTAAARVGWLVAVALVFAPGGLRAAEGDPSKAGAYCPLPKPGEKPACLAPAEAQYGDFFAAVDEGTISDETAAQVEQDLRALQATDRAYMALSSLSYGYWRLAMRAAEAEEPDPAVLRQLQRWNDLLTAAYRESGEDPEFRDAVRTAAVDLDEHTPEDGLKCLDADGNPMRCRPTAGLVASIDSLDEQLGVRGAIRRVLDRMVGDEDDG